MIWYVFMHYLCGTEVAQTMYLVCILCGTWNRKSSFSFTELSLNTFFPNNNNASQSWPTVQLAVPLCACTGLLVQHSLTVITINSSLTECTVGADRMLTDVYTISCQLSTAHIFTVPYQKTNLSYTQQYILLHSAIWKQQTYSTLNSTYCYTVRYQNNKPILHSTVHIVTVQYQNNKPILHSTVHIVTVQYQNNKPILHLTHFTTTNNNSVQHPSVLNSTER